MKFSKGIHAIDSHTMGEPTRIVVGGIPQINGETMADKKKYLEDNLDYVRTALMHEPRGHNDMFGSIITSSNNKEADFGIIFMDGGGYLNMCGHGSIGAATVAVETGMVEMVEPVTNINMEAPAGLIKAKVMVENEKVKEVSITNVPSFLYMEDATLEVPSLNKTITFDISFGGSFFAIIHAKELGVNVETSQVDVLKKLGIDKKIIVISTGKNIDRTKHFDFGVALGELIEKNEKNIAIIASGDLSHRLKKKSPGGYSPKGAKFDNKIIENLSTDNQAAEQLLKMEEKLIEAAGECAYKSLIITLGILKNKNFESEILAYQNDFGVGYLSTDFKL